MQGFPFGGARIFTENIFYMLFFHSSMQNVLEGVRGWKSNWIWGGEML